MKSTNSISYDSKRNQLSASSEINYTQQQVEQVDQQKAQFEITIDLDKQFDEVKQFVLNLFKDKICPIHGQIIDMIYVSIDQQFSIDNNLICSSCMLQKDFFLKEHKLDIVPIKLFIENQLNKIFGLEIRQKFQQQLKKKNILQQALEDYFSIKNITKNLDETIEKLISFKNLIQKKNQEDLLDYKRLILKQIDNKFSSIEENLSQHEKQMLGNTQNFSQFVQSHPTMLTNPIEVVLYQLIHRSKIYPGKTFIEDQAAKILEIQQNLSRILIKQNQIQNFINEAIKPFSKTLEEENYFMDLKQKQEFNESIPKDVEIFNRNVMQAKNISFISCKGFIHSIHHYKDKIFSNAIQDQNIIINQINSDGSLSQVNSIKLGGIVQGITINKNFLFVSYEKVLQIYDIEDSSKPQLILSKSISVQKPIFLKFINQNILAILGKQGHISFIKFQIDLQQTQYEFHTQINSNNSEQLSVTCYEVYSSSLYIGFKDGSVRSLSIDFNEENNLQVRQNLSMDSLEKDVKVSCLQFDQKGRLWIGYQNGFLGIINTSNNQVVHKIRAFSDCIYQMIPLATELMIICSWNGKIITVGSKFETQSQIYHQLKNTPKNHLNPHSSIILQNARQEYTLYTSGNQDKQIQSFRIDFQ